MNQVPAPQTLPAACKIIAAELGVSVELVELVAKAVFIKIATALKQEIPFSVSDFGKFFCKYNKSKMTRYSSEYLKGKVSRTIDFKPADSLKMRVGGHVHDLGISNNLPEETIKISIRPDEISKIRRSKMLEEQKKIGFRPELLFTDETLPQPDKDLSKHLEKAPSVEELVEQILGNVEKDNGRG